MCGICGVVAPEPGDLGAVVDAQLATLEHRGPDARGSFAGSQRGDRAEPPRDHRPRHRRPADHQRGRTVAVVLNGEIYNFRELREELLRARPRAALARRHRGDRPSRRGARAGRSRAAPRRHVRVRRLGRAPAAARAGPRPGGQEAALLLVLGRAARLRQRDQGAVRRSLGRRGAWMPRRSPPT